MKRINILFALLFFTALACNIYVIADHQILRCISKTALMPILLAIYLYNTNKRTENRLLFVAALFFSWLGDILLLFDSNLFFMLGIAGFLCAQLAYTTYFGKESKGSKIRITILPFLIFLGGFLFMIYNHLLKEGNNNIFLLPITVYAIVITAMGYFATLRPKMPKSSYIMVVLGALLFIISDCSIAVNSFLLPEHNILLGKFVMLSYGLAQFLILCGVLKQRL